MDVFAVFRTFEDSTFLRWTGPGTLTGKTEEPLRAQEAGIRRLVESARQAGFKGLPPLRIRIRCKIEDRRLKSHDAVATPNNHWFSID